MNAPCAWGPFPPLSLGAHVGPRHFGKVLTLHDFDVPLMFNIHTHPSGPALAGLRADGCGTATRTYQMRPSVVILRACSLQTALACSLMSFSTPTHLRSHCGMAQSHFVSYTDSSGKRINTSQASGASTGPAYHHRMVVLTPTVPTTVHTGLGRPLRCASACPHSSRRRLSLESRPYSA
jgi:hypothetical protein